MAEPLNLLELLSTPERDASLVKGRQVGALGGPAHVRLRPALWRKPGPAFARRAAKH